MGFYALGGLQSFFPDGWEPREAGDADWLCEYVIYSNHLVDIFVRPFVVEGFR